MVFRACFWPQQNFGPVALVIYSEALITFLLGRLLESSCKLEFVLYIDI